MWLIKPILNDSRGFTLTELSITVVVASLLVLVAGSLMITSNEILVQSRIETRSIQDHSLISYLFAYTIKEGESQLSTIYTDSSMTTASSSGNCLSVTNPDMETTSLYFSNHDFVMIKPNGTINRVVENIVNNLSFSERFNQDSIRTIQISLTTDQNGYSLSTNHVYSFRN